MHDEHFNPRSLAGATRISCANVNLTANFNPRSLAGATSRVILQMRSVSNFNPRSLAGATPIVSVACSVGCISIHAPSRERRLISSPLFIPVYFNPRSLAGATMFCIACSPKWAFQSTLPRGSDESEQLEPAKTNAISIHAPSRERPTNPCRHPPKRNFNPRSLAGATLRRRAPKG